MVTSIIIHNCFSNFYFLKQEIEQRPMFINSIEKLSISECDDCLPQLENNINIFNDFVHIDKNLPFVAQLVNHIIQNARTKNVINQYNDKNKKNSLCTQYLKKTPRQSCEVELLIKIV